MVARGLQRTWQFGSSSPVQFLSAELDWPGCLESLEENAFMWLLKCAWYYLSFQWLRGAFHSPAGQHFMRVNLSETGYIDTYRSLCSWTSGTSQDVGRYFYPPSIAGLSVTLSVWRSGAKVPNTYSQIYSNATCIYRLPAYNDRIYRSSGAYSPCYWTCIKRPPVYKGNFFSVRRVVFIYKFHCTYHHIETWHCIFAQYTACIIVLLYPYSIFSSLLGFF